jgi:hypothetical protein
MVVSMSMRLARRHFGDLSLLVAQVIAWTEIQK